jgi:hypothetical protein
MINKEVFKEYLPYMYEEYEKGNVHLWDGAGFTRALTDEHKKEIERLETEYKGLNLKVLGVFEGTYNLGGDQCHMTAYAYTDDQYDNDPEIIDDEDGVVAFMAYVDNDSWGIQEYGDVCLKETVGCVMRVY